MLTKCSLITRIQNQVQVTLNFSSLFHAIEFCLFSCSAKKRLISCSNLALLCCAVLCCAVTSRLAEDQQVLLGLLEKPRLA